MKHRYYRIEAQLKPLSQKMFRRFKRYLRKKVGLKFMKKTGVEGIVSLLAASFKEQKVATMIEQSLHNVESLTSRSMASSNIDMKDLQTSTARRCYHRIEAKLKPFSAKMLRQFKRYLRKNVGLKFKKKIGVEGIASLLAASFKEKKVVSMIEQSLHNTESKTSPPMISPKMEVEEEKLLPHMDMKDVQTSKVTKRSGLKAILGGGVTNSNTSTAVDGSNTFAPSASCCTVRGDLKLTMNINHTNYYASNKDDSQRSEMDKSCRLTNQQALRPIPLYDQNKEKDNIQRIREQIQLWERRRNCNVPEGIVQAKSCLSMYNIQLHVVTSEYTSINNEHGVWQAEVTNLEDNSETLTVDCNDMFKALPGEDKCIRCVLTKGTAGIGKTEAVQRFTLDWADGKANQNIDFIINLPFRKLNLVAHKRFSLHGLLRDFYKNFGDIKDMDFYDKHTFLLILDGMDETKLPLEFEKNYSVSDVTELTTLDVLMTSLLSGKLLPGALLWITCRPPAAKRLHQGNSTIDRVTEIRGLSDSQKVDYLKRKIKDPEMVCRVIAHIKATLSLDTMCSLPVLCWMSSEVLLKILSEEVRAKRKPKPLPQTLTEMYAHYIIPQMCTLLKRLPRTGVHGYNSKMEHGDRETILKLGNLAYNTLISENTLFTAQDLRDCKISKEEAAKCHAVHTEPLDLESGLHEKEVYCFVHHSIQEFLAALYAFHEFANNRFNSVRAILKAKTCRDSISLSDFLKGALDCALDTKNGHLDLFVRFLFGISHNSCRDFLKYFVPEIPSSECYKELKRYIFEDMLNKKDLSPERCINIIHCLSQLKDHSDLTEFVSVKSLSPIQCTLLTYKHVILEKPGVFDFRNRKTSEEGFHRLAPALRSSTTALLSFCDITPQISLSSTVASVLCTDKSRLTTLDLSHNSLGDAGVRRLCEGLLHQNSSVESLNLSHNSIGTRGVDALCDVLTSPTSRLLTLDLSSNDVADLGAASLSIALGQPECKLQLLRLAGCRIRQSTFLTRVLRSIPTLLRDLDLRYNPLNDISTYVLSELKKLGVSVSVDHGGEGRDKPGMQKYACDISLDVSKTKRYRLNCKGDRKVFKIAQFNQVQSKEGLCQRHYLEMDCVPAVHIGMTYAQMPSEGAGDKITLGSSDHCWNLNFSRDKCCVQHKNFLHTLSPPVIDSTGYVKIGVYLDWPAGILSYYVKSGTLTRLYSFHTKFTEPLHLVLGLNSPNATIYLSQICLKAFP